MGAVKAGWCFLHDADQVSTFKSALVADWPAGEGLNLKDTFSWVGYYCGRFGDGLAGELQNSLSNVAFLIAAAIAFQIWRTGSQRDGFQLILIIMVALIGLGSFVFHSHPGPATLQIDLIPIQIFGLAAFFYLARREFGLSIWAAVLTIVVFFLLRQGWIMVAPRGALGGGVTHVPMVLLLIGSGSWLAYRNRGVGTYLLIAAAFYCVALAARTVDVAACADFPLGFHWLWHFMTAAVAGVVLIGFIKHIDTPPAGRGR